jgi:hypothetical protein
VRSEKSIGASRIAKLTKHIDGPDERQAERRQSAQAAMDQRYGAGEGGAGQGSKSDAVALSVDLQVGAQWSRSNASGLALAGGMALSDRPVTEGELRTAANHQASKNTQADQVPAIVVLLAL